jgi:Rod binding domain-containing protein
MDAAALSVPLDLIKPASLPSSGALPVAGVATRARIDVTAKQFETQFMSVMLGQMFQGVETSAPFGGGEAESTFKSFLTDAFAKSVVKHGGIGMAKDISREMLKLQGLS